MRFLLTSLLFGAYFAMWFDYRDRLKGSDARGGRHGASAGALANVLGLSAGPCSVMGCGAPVLPVVGLAVAGISSGTLTFFAELSRAAIAVVFVAMALGVAYFGWLVGAPARRSSAGSPGA